MKITLRDEVKTFEKGTTLTAIATSISEGLARVALCARVNGQLNDMQTCINEDSVVEFLTFDDEEGKQVYWHSSAHIMAQAVKRIYPTVKIAIGPAIEKGFYYDFDFKTPISKDALSSIEDEMKKIIKENLPIVREVMTKKQALRFMREFDETYKVELINFLDKDEVITFYRQGDFIDLCAGPHVPSTGVIKAFKLTSVTGAYWRGDEKNKMLTRIYGISFPKRTQLNEHLIAVEEAKKRDHNKLGRELGFFMNDKRVGQGLPLFMPKGAKLFQILTRFVEDEEEKRGYKYTRTPYLAKSDLYKISGHWQHYKDGMFVMGEENSDEEILALRPMTCPFQYLIYNNGLKSYRDLPIKYAETSTIFRNEASGEMHGLIRVRQFTISEGHIICMPTQLEQEFKNSLELAIYMLKSLGLYEDISYRFSRWDVNNAEKYIGEPKAWEQAESQMENILDNLGLEYSQAVGEAAFYGPKLDIQIRNVHGKEDTLITIQIDMFLAEKFEMVYIDQNGERAFPYIIHRTSIGCYERTMALLIEKYAGALPTWLSPIQIKVLSLTDRTAEDVIDFVDKLQRLGFRAESDTRGEKIGYKIREAQIEKIPYMLIIGDKEKANNSIAVRSRKNGDMGSMTKEAFILMLKDEVDNRVLN